MARNLPAAKRGWLYDLPNATLSAYVDGTKSFSLTTSSFTMTNSTVAANARAFREVYTVATPAMSDGYGVHEIDLTLSGTATGQIAVTSTWLNLPSSASILASGNYVFLHSDGIYEHTDATITGAFIAFQKYSAILADSDNTHLHIWNLNLTGKAITALIEVNNPAKLSFSAGTSHGSVQGTIPLYTTGLGSTMYVAVYNTQGAG